MVTSYTEAGRLPGLDQALGRGDHAGWEALGEALRAESYAPAERGGEDTGGMEPAAHLQPVIVARVHGRDESVAPGERVHLAPMGTTVQVVQCFLVGRQQLVSALVAGELDELDHHRVAPVHH